MSNLDAIAPPTVGRPAGAIPAAKEARTKEMALEFEATFMSMLLKQMRESSEGEDGFFPGDSSDIQGGLFDLYLGRHIADAGGIGLAAAVMRSAGPPPAATPPTPLAPTNGPSPRLPAGGPLLPTPRR